MPELIVSSRATVVAESESDAENTVLKSLESMPGVVAVLISGTATADASAESGKESGRRTYGDVAGPNVPSVSRERRERLLAWLRDDMAPMTVAEIVLCADRIYGPRDDDVARNDLNQLERYGLLRNFGRPKRWSTT